MELRSLQSRERPERGSLEEDTFHRLFNPRTDVWDDHFEWNEAMLVGKTAIGRVTIKVLQINRPKRLETRRLLMGANLFAD